VAGVAEELSIGAGRSIEEELFIAAGVPIEGELSTVAVRCIAVAPSIAAVIMEAAVTMARSADITLIHPAVAGTMAEAAFIAAEPYIAAEPFIVVALSTAEVRSTEAAGITAIRVQDRGTVNG
jgi:hypothetical protein